MERRGLHLSQRHPYRLEVRDARRIRRLQGGMLRDARKRVVCWTIADDHDCAAHCLFRAYGHRYREVDSIAVVRRRIESRFYKNRFAECSQSDSELEIRETGAAL